MPFNHNHAYHGLLLRQIPSRARNALDVGCGTGKFARRLAAKGLDVDAIDPARYVLDLARAYPTPSPVSGAAAGTITYREGDAGRADLRPEGYDFISCIASLHHMPFAVVSRFAAALRPGGVIAVLGLARASSIGDYVTWGLLAPPANLAGRALALAGDQLNGGPDAVTPPVKDSAMTMAALRRESADRLPGRRLRVLLFWRYLLTWRRPD